MKIYLDYAATTPVDPRVAEVMSRYLLKEHTFGNPSSTHFYGQAAKAVIDHARQQVGALIHADGAEIIWTSGATEANNLALKGIATLYQQQGKHIVTVKTEHAAVLDCCQHLEKNGFEITYLTPEKNGRISLDAFHSALRHDTILVSVMHVNNETGVIQDIAAIGKITHAKNILFHVDAAQSAGKIPIHVNAMHVDLMSLSAHKVYGPKGVGALYIRQKPRIRVAAQMHGGGHESGMRSGTLATHQIVGMGEAFAIAQKNMQEDYQKIFSYREKILKAISQRENFFLNSDPAITVPHIINFGLKSLKSDEIMKALSDIAISSGSACSSKGIEPSYVLRAMGLSFQDAASSVRISLGRFTTQEEIDFFIEHLNNLHRKK